MLKMVGYLRWIKKTAVANNTFLAQEIQVSAKTVPFHRRHIQPLEGSNCIMIGRRALVRTLSLIRSSSRLTVEACSMIDSGVVNTMCRAVGDDIADKDEDRRDENGDLELNCFPLVFRCKT